MTAPSPVPRRVRVPSWLDVRLAIGLLLVLGSMLLGARVIAGADSRARVVDFSTDLHRGSVLTRDELGYVRAAVPGGAAVYLTDVDAAVGHVLNRDVGRGELVAGAALDLPPPTTSLVVPLEPDAAPKVAAGDRVEIWLSSPACPAAVVLPDVTVQAVHDNASRSFGSAQGESFVLDLRADLARRVVDAMAVDGAVLRAGRLHGDAADAADLVDLDSCRAPKK